MALQKQHIGFNMDGQPIENAVFNAALNTLTNLLLSHFGAGVVQTTMPATPDDTSVTTSLGTKTYVDGLIQQINTTIANMSALGSMTGTIDITSGNANLPVTNAPGWWVITGTAGQAGTLGGASGFHVHVGDTLISKGASLGGDFAAAGADFVVSSGSHPFATNVDHGMVRFATPAEVAAGTASDVVVSPADLKTATATTAAPYQEDWASGTTKTVTAAVHGLGMVGNLITGYVRGVDGETLAMISPKVNRVTGDATFEIGYDATGKGLTVVLYKIK